MRRSHDQIIDNTNIDSVLFAGFDTQQEENADRILATFHEFIEENKDEIIALRIIYNESYKDRPMAIEQLKAVWQVESQGHHRRTPVGLLCHQEAGQGKAWHDGATDRPHLHHSL